MNETPSPSSVVQLTEICKVFPTTAEPLHILNGVSLKLEKGAAVAVTGPSGSGKSTLLYIAGLLDTPTSGEVQLLGENVLQLDENAAAIFRNQHIGFIFQDHHLLPQCTVLENVLLPRLANRGTDAESTSRAKELLARVGLQDRLHHQPMRISGGERQRVAVCRALINQPQILLADEPTGNLDQTRAEEIGSLLLELSREQETVLVCVTHSRDLASRFPLHYELENGTLSESAHQTVSSK